MPKGKGTYGSKKGRPKKMKAKSKSKPKKKKKVKFGDQIGNSRRYKK